MTKRDRQAAEYVAEQTVSMTGHEVVANLRKLADIYEGVALGRSGVYPAAQAAATVKAAEKLLREADAMMPRWVSVGEALPEEYKTVLVATSGSVSAGEIRFPDDECGMSEPWWMVFKDIRDSGTACGWAGFVSLNDVSHWMPLPGPPGTVVLD